MKIIKNILIRGSKGKSMATDLFIPETDEPCPVVIYAHGFNGFKDWGNFDLIAQQFAATEYIFIKFNFSHNGTTPDAPEAFVDLDAYAENNYSKELSDLQSILDWVCATDNPYMAMMDTDRIGLIGHSLGGGIAILTAAHDSRIKALTTWASISACQTPWTHWPDVQMREWKERGVQYVTNSRTGQQLPLHYQLYEDYMLHEERLNIKEAAKRIAVPWLICHGTNDTSVPIASAERLQEWQPQAILFTVASDHVFGRKHPWTSDKLPEAMQDVTDKTIAFFDVALRRENIE